MEFLPIHIGMHKTATSFLQSLVFPQMFPHAPRSEEGWLANEGIEYNGIMLSIADALDRTDPASAFDIRQRHHSSEEESVVLSAESWSGRQYSSFENESWNRFHYFLNAISKIKRTPRIVMFVRPHKEWLRSGFLHQYRLGARQSFESYVKSFSGYDLNWSKRARALQDFESRIYSYEEFQQKPLDIINDICDFWGIQPFTKLSEGRVNSAPKKLVTLNAMRICHQGATVIKRITKSKRAENILRKFSETELRKIDKLLTHSVFSESYKMKGLDIPPHQAEKFLADWAELEPFLRKLNDTDCTQSKYIGEQSKAHGIY